MNNRINSIIVLFIMVLPVSYMFVIQVWRRCRAKAQSQSRLCQVGSSHSSFPFLTLPILNLIKQTMTMTMTKQRNNVK